MVENLVSIIIPCYNGEKYLAQTLESVLWQTYPNWECILVDDGSTDNSAEIFKKYMSKDLRFKYIHQENKGLAGARNTGISLAKGEYIQFLDADDILLNERLKLCINQFKQNIEIDVVYTDYICFDSINGYSHFLPAKITYEDYARAFMFHFSIDFIALVHSFLFKKNVIEKNRFDENLGSYAEDIECWIRIALSGAKFYYIDEILSVYRRSKSSLTYDEVAVFSANLKVMQKYENHPKSVEYRSDYLKAVQHYQERLAIAYLMNKQIKIGVNEMKKAWMSASASSKAKFITWLILMSLFPKQWVFILRYWLLKKIIKKDKYAKVWEPSQQVKKLLEEVD